MGDVDSRLNIVHGDILHCDCKFIAHQCNCISERFSGVAYKIFEKYPHVKKEVIRTIRQYDKPIRLKLLVGNIVVAGDGKDYPYVINMFGQYAPGAPVQSPYTGDSSISRVKYFINCLNNIVDIHSKTKIESIAFPYKIGCGLAQGNWEIYGNLLADFTEIVKKQLDIEVKVYKNS
jgi:O-acetyl-ADP-ribose deacetylase (regulator of RNase III)